MHHILVGKELKLTSFRYVAKFPGRDPRDMRVMKHFAEVIGRGIKARLEAELAAEPDDGKKKNKRANTWSVRNKMRRFYNMWERQMHLNIADEVQESMAPVSPNQTWAGSKHCCRSSILTGKSIHRG